MPASHDPRRLTDDQGREVADVIPNAGDEERVSLAQLKQQLVADRLLLRNEFARSATKDPRGSDRKRIPKIAGIACPAADPRPDGCKKLVGAQPTYRMRIGDYRVIYDIQDKVGVVLIARIRHPRDVHP